MAEPDWPAVSAALTEASDKAPLRFWLRDDDAVAVTPALDRLAATASGAPLLIAAIPLGASATLGRWAARTAGVTVAQHGYAHHNHAGPGERACELGGGRDDATVFSELAAGRAAMDNAFGKAGWMRLLVPPWNRIRASLLPYLPAAGYRALSTFAGTQPGVVPGLARLNCDLDIIDWRDSRRGRDDADIVRRVVGLIRASRSTGAPIGVLTHHLAHDDQAWHVIERLLPLLAGHPNARIVRVDELLSDASPSS